jgi:hypothetical protein
MAHGFAKANQFAASASQSVTAITTTISRSNPTRRGFDPRATNNQTHTMNNKNTTHFTEYTWHAMRQLKKELQSKNSQMRKAMRSFKKNREQK